MKVAKQQADNKEQGILSMKLRKGSPRTTEKFTEFVRDVITGQREETKDVSSKNVRSASASNL